MIRINFKEEEIAILSKERYGNYPANVRNRIEAIYLKSQGLKHNKICQLCNISRNTLVRYLHNYKEKKLEGLTTWGYKGRESELENHRESLLKYFEKDPPSSISEAQQMVEKQTGIKRCPSQIHNFLLKLGLKYRKVGFVPNKVDQKEKQQEQKQFIKKLKPLLNEAKKGKLNMQ